METLHRNLTNAATHALGALMIYMASIDGCESIVIAPGTPVLREEEKTALAILAKEIDLQVVQYKLSERLQLRAASLRDGTFAPELSELHDEDRIVSQLHTCYAFISTAAKYRYWVHGSSRSDFASEMVSARAESTRPGSDYRLISILPQPLFQTAMKCRDFHIRRRAVELLTKTGKEGPWDSRVLVAIARRAIEIEERSLEHGHGVMGEVTVPEGARLRNDGMGHISRDTGAPVDGVLQTLDTIARPRIIEFRFQRCLNVDEFVKENTLGEGSKLWIAWDEVIEV